MPACRARYPSRRVTIPVAASSGENSSTYNRPVTERFQGQTVVVTGATGESARITAMIPDKRLPGEFFMSRIVRSRPPSLRFRSADLLPDIGHELGEPARLVEVCPVAGAVEKHSALGGCLQAGEPLLGQDRPAPGFPVPEHHVVRHLQAGDVLAEIDLLELGIEGSVRVEEAPEGVGPVHEGVLRDEENGRHLVGHVQFGVGVPTVSLFTTGS